MNNLTKIRTTKSLYDNFGRIHNYLRISLTERCNLRCRYCMPPEGVSLTAKDQLLKLDELIRLSEIFVKSCGIKKIRLTGGEPTIDSKMEPILEHLDSLRSHGLETIAMTTNGLTLKRKSSRYKELGLDAVNISIDSLTPDRYESISGRKGHDLVMNGIKQAIETKFAQIKLNCVVMKGINDDEMVDFCRLATLYPVDVRFIEFMPFLGNRWKIDLLMPYNEMLRRVEDKYPTLKRANAMEQPHDTSKIFKSPEMIGSIGFITSMTKNFCSDCNRLRLTSDGQLRVCLFDKRETSLRDLVRNGASDDEVIIAIQSSLSEKKKQHAALTFQGRDTQRPMIKIARVSGLHSNGTLGGYKFTHLSDTGEARMVDVSNKAPVRRTAVARGEIQVGHQVLKMIRQQKMNKGDIVTVAKVAGILGAKQTSALIPMCHQIPLDHVQVVISECCQTGSLLVEAQVEALHKTGVEMECLMAVTTSLLTIYDMCKSVNSSMLITNIQLVKKTKVLHTPEKI